MKFLLLLTLITYSAFADNYIKGEGRYYAHENDSLTFIKNELVSRALGDVISKELDEMGLNKELFWKKYDERLEKMNQASDEALKNKYKIGKEEQTTKNARDYQENLRTRKLINRQKLGNLKRILKSYAIKKLSRSPNDPKARYILIDANVSRDTLSKIYYSFVQIKKSSKYGSLYIYVDYAFENFVLSDIGVRGEDEFKQAITEKWNNWFSQNKPNNIANVEIMDDSKYEKLKSYLKLPYERMINEIPDIFVNSLFLHVSIEIDKVKINHEFSEYVFDFSGGMYLQDLQNLQVLKSFTFEKENKRYPLIDKSKIGSLVATNVYNMPRPNFTKLKETIGNIPPLSFIQRLVLFDYNNINDVYELMKAINSRGIRYAARTRLESLSKSRAELIVFFDGKVEQLKLLLQEVQSAKKDLSLDIIDADDVLGIKFNRLEQKKTI